MHLYDFAKNLVLEAGNNIRKWMHEDIEIESKSNPNDLVTNVDKAVETFIISQIESQYPYHKMIGEEGHGHDIESTNGVVWVIDPIDGTLNFIHQKQNFAISVGIFKDGKPYAGFVYDVMRDILYHAKSGHGAYKNETPVPPLKDTLLSESIVGLNPNWLTKPKMGPILQPIIQDSRTARAYGSAALEIVYVATGLLSAYITPRLHSWDYAGGLIILQEVGGEGTNFLGEPLSITTHSTVLFGNRAVHKHILNEYFKPHENELKALQQRYQ